MKILLVALVLLSAQVSFAVNECFIKRQVRNFRLINDFSIQVDTGLKDYLLDVSYCRELKWAHKIAFNSFSSVRVCRGDQILILDNFSHQVIESCRIHNITQMN